MAGFFHTQLVMNGRIWIRIRIRIRQKVWIWPNPDPYQQYLLSVYKMNQYWPRSRAERPILSSAPRGGGGWGPPLSIGTQEVETYIYSRTYTAHGALGTLL
jgi:hypothetical protein